MPHFNCRIVLSETVSSLHICNQNIAVLHITSTVHTVVDKFLFQIYRGMEICCCGQQIMVTFTC